MGIEGLRVAVIIPAYRAADSIEKVIAGVPAWVDAVYVVDDASPDQTATRVRALADPRVHLLAHEVNRGVGAAMVTGYRRALRDGMDVCVKMDADDQMDPTRLPDLIEPLASGRADFSKGNRFHDADALRRMPDLRKVGNAGLSLLTKAVSGQWHVFDPTNGYTAIHRTVLARLDLGNLHSRYFFESSMLILLGRNRAVVEDVPLPARYGDETSHLSIRRALLEFPWLLFRHGLRRIAWQYFVADFDVVSLFLVTGIPLVAFGFLFGLYHWVQSSRGGVLTSTGTVMLAVLPMILGFQLLLQAVVLDVQNVPTRPLQAGSRLRARGQPPGSALD